MSSLGAKEAQPKTKKDKNTKQEHRKKSSGDLCGQLTMLKVVPSNYLLPNKGSGGYKWYQSRRTIVSCAGGQPPSRVKILR